MSGPQVFPWDSGRPGRRVRRARGVVAVVGDFLQNPPIGRLVSPPCRLARSWGCMRHSLPEVAGGLGRQLQSGARCKRGHTPLLRSICSHVLRRRHALTHRKWFCVAALLRRAFPHQNRRGVRASSSSAPSGCSLIPLSDAMYAGWHRVSARFTGSGSPVWTRSTWLRTALAL